jgi:hypothetical protein
MPKKGKAKIKEEELWNGDEEERAMEEKMKKLAMEDGAGGKDKKKKKKSKLAQLAELMAAEDNEEGLGLYLFFMFGFYFIPYLLLKYISC